MEVTLQGLTGTFVYLDDLLLFTKTKEEHLKLMKECLKRLAANQMPLSLEKCSFGQDSVNYLGYKVDSQGIKPLQKKL